MLTLKINTDNAAFEDNGVGSEVAVILRRLANNIEDLEGRDLDESFALMDSNGNKVGNAFLVP